MSVTETTPEKRLDWSMQDVCGWFGVSRWTVAQWMKKEGEDRIPHYRPGGGVPRFSSVEVKEWGFSK